MGRVKRVLRHDIGYHVIARCNNRERLLSKFEDRDRFLSVCGHYMRKYAFELHAYVIMPSHVHMMITTRSGKYLDSIMHDICDTYALYYKKKYSRIGHFWISPYRGKILYDDLYALTCLRYIHQNPARAGIVAKPLDWKCSSHQFYLKGRQADRVIITPHTSYLALADSEWDRRSIYRGILMEAEVEADLEWRLFEGRMKYKARRCVGYFDRLAKVLRLK